MPCDINHIDKPNVKLVISLDVMIPIYTPFSVPKNKERYCITGFFQGGHILQNLGKFVKITDTKKILYS